jgi:hypothetical protein
MSYLKKVVTMLLVAIAIVTITSGCAFSIPINDRVRCDIQIDAQLISTEQLPAIWLNDK